MKRINLYGGYSYWQEHRLKQIREELELQERIERITGKKGAY